MLQELDVGEAAAEGASEAPAAFLGNLDFAKVFGEPMVALNDKVAGLHRLTS